MLNNLATVYSEEVHHRVSEILGMPFPMRMKDHNVAIRKCSLDLHMRLGVIGLSHEINFVTPLHIPAQPNERSPWMRCAIADSLASPSGDQGDDEKAMT
jgi:hypothetical protein